MSLCECILIRQESNGYSRKVLVSRVIVCSISYEVGNNQNGLDEWDISNPRIAAATHMICPKAGRGNSIWRWRVEGEGVYMTDPRPQSDLIQFPFKLICKDPGRSHRLGIPRRPKSETSLNKWQSMKGFDSMRLISNVCTKDLPQVWWSAEVYSCAKTYVSAWDCLDSAIPLAAYPMIRFALIATPCNAISP